MTDCRLFIAAVFIYLGAAVSGAELAQAEETSRRGLITSGACPLTCEELGVPRESCREIRSDGGTCQVEDFTQAPGHRSLVKVGKELIIDAEEERADAAQGTENRRGLITSSPCPYSCKMANVPAALCREWNTGAKCYVEDLSQPPGHRSRLVAN